MNHQALIKTIKEHIWGPVGSVIFHILLIVVLLKVAANVAADKPAEIAVQVMDIKPMANVEEIKREVEKIRKVEDVEEIPDRVIPPDMNEVSSSVDNNSNQASDGAGEGFGGATGFGSSADGLAGLDVAESTGPLVMSGLYVGRSPGGRGGALAKYGGRFQHETEPAVIKALRWLKEHQNPDGSWGPNTIAMTGLAILTYLAHGETTGSKEYGTVVRKAIDYLASKQKDDGQFGDAMTQPGVYAHGIATYAISEAYGLCRIPDLKERMEKAAKIIINGQQPGGLWDYAYKKAERRDTSVAGWQLQALKAAYINKAEVPGLHDAIEKGVAGLKSIQNQDNGRFGYSSPAQGNDSITGIGVLCLQLSGHAGDKETAAGVRAMAEFDADWKSPTKWPMYAWYYITQAKFQVGSGTWNNWNSKIAPVLTKNQSEDGHWDSPTGGAAESEETKQGPVYSTCLAALTLQVYYRFLPTYQPMKAEPQKNEGKDDIIVDVT